MKIIKRSFALATLVFITVSVYSGSVFAQCAMCRATLENNISHGDIGIAAGLNTGILYLFATPYLLVAFMAYMWYRRSRINAEARSYHSR